MTNHERTSSRSRAARIVAGTLAAGLGLASATTAASAGTDGPQTGNGCSALDPVPLHFQEYGTPRDSGTAVIRDPDAMAAYWRFLTGNDTLPAAIQSMESGRIAVAVHAGRQNSGGYSLEITECRTIGRRLALTVTLSPPAGAATRALTTPAAFWAIDDPGMPIDVSLATQERRSAGDPD